MTYRLLKSAEDQVDRVLLDGAREWGIEAAGRYHRLMLVVFESLGDAPALHGSQPIPRIAGVRTYPLRLARTWVDPERRVGHPRHIVVYRVGSDGVTEIIGVAHDRMLLARAARRMLRDAG